MAVFLPLSRFKRFNPRARVGRDTPCAARCLRRFCFNPRARVGRDEQIPHVAG